MATGETPVTQLPHRTFNNSTNNVNVNVNANANANVNANANANANTNANANVNAHNSHNRTESNLAAIMMGYVLVTFS